jgi:predicted Zn-dependent peptidase
VASGLAAGRARARALPYERSVLASGLRVVTQPMPAARSVAVGLFVGVGSRHEDEAHAGLSHLLEHLVFKGTRRYPEPGGLSEAVEGSGGSVNASTDRELTVYSARVPAEAASRALEVIADLVISPLLRRRDLIGEKPVIVDEIRMYVDSPGDHVFSLFDQLLFGRHPLGREIAGTVRSVRRASHERVMAHWERWYRPANLVLAAAGAIRHDEAPAAASAGSLRVAFRRLSQGNLCLGMPGVARDHADRWALDLLGAVLGDGMSSRLFVELRERRSLTYDVSTFGATYSDCGTFGVHAGFDPEQAGALLTGILEQLERVVQEPVSAPELDRARAYTRGRLLLRMEETGAVASWLGTGESLLPRILTVDEVIERLEAVTLDDLLRVARQYARPDLARLAVLGPFRSRLPFGRMLSR